ncbi:MAG TPA: iron-sulfur cluster assembly accessory protein [Thermosynechococcaceae cyanobacterium]
MIQISPTAIAEILRLRKRVSDSNLVLRLEVLPAGCLGSLYALNFVEAVREDDRVYECSELQVAIDAVTQASVEGLRVDYSEDLMGGGFRFDNPRVAQTCGCGNSFTLASPQEHQLSEKSRGSGF